MIIHIECGNNAGTRVDKDLDVSTTNVEDIFAELAQIIHWAKKNKSEKITLTVRNLYDRSN